MNKTAMGLLLALGVMSGAQAASVIEVGQAWSRMTAPSVPMGAIFVELKNTGDADDVLVSATTARSPQVELHTTIDDNGVMRMREVAGGIALPKGQTVSLKPGGYHIMLMKLPKPLVLNDEYQVTLKFKQAPSQTVNVKVNNGVGMVNGMAAKAMDHSGHGGH
ncbi:copper chaperone PCu(A)C [Neisseriaceae bacterium CLB008]